MIYTVTRLFSEKEEYLNGKETKRQKDSRKKLTGSLVGLGTALGTQIGIETAGSKNLERAKKIAKRADEDSAKVIGALEKMATKFEEKGSRFKDQQSKDAFEGALKWGSQRVKNNIKSVNRAFKVAAAMDNKATLKRGLKGAAIGTAVMAPLAYAANKSIKNRNEEINRSRRGKKRGLDPKEYSKKPTWTVKEESEWTTNAHFTEPMRKHYKMSRVGKDMVAGLTGMATGGLLASAKSKKGSDALIGGILGAAGGVGLAKAHRRLTKKDKKAEELINSGSKEYNKLEEKYLKRCRAGKSKSWKLLDEMSDLKDNTKKDLAEL